MAGIIKKVAGPLVVARNMRDANMFDVVHVGEDHLIGEIIEMHEDLASIQVYEETSGLGLKASVESTGSQLSMELGPGLIGEIFDGIGRPLKSLMNLLGNNLRRGVKVSSLNREKIWEFEAILKPGDKICQGEVLGYVKETPAVIHKIMVPNGVFGTLTKIESGSFKISDFIALAKDPNGKEIQITMMQKWPVRTGRPYKKKLSPSVPMITGQRVIDAFFPIAKGGVAVVPGPFGSGKTVVQHQLAKFSDADIVVYIGCGERGNEMTDVLNEFPSIVDPKTGNSLMQRTVLIANTSDMPVAAREASIYTGVTIAEYFRDMGYSVALMADSTSRWAEALREISGRLEEMPGEEGYPAYLGSRLSSFYERSGRVKVNGKEGKNEDREGVLTIIGAVSPAGGDISEPVSQATLRIVKVFWGLDSNLAYKRHFPAINWLNSYSLYTKTLSKWYEQNVSEQWTKLVNKMLNFLTEESNLEEVVKLVGIDAISSEDRLKLEVARSIREDFLHQNAFHDIDAFTSLKKQHLIMKLIIKYHESALISLQNGTCIEEIVSISSRESIGRFKYIKEEFTDEEYEKISSDILHELASINKNEESYV